MAEDVIYQKRNILIIGRTGTGKKTLANHIVKNSTPSTVFQLSSSSMENNTREPTLVTCSARDDHRKLLYNIVIWDTYSTETSGKTSPQDLSGYCSEDKEDVPDGINLVIFTMKNGALHEEKELKLFKSIAKNFKEIQDISALVITGCESLEDEEREELVEQVKNEDATKDIAKFMGKGIFPVGFPPLERVKAALKEAYQDGIDADSETLQTLANNSGEMTTVIQLRNNLKKMREHINSSDRFSCKIM
ncbi:uncharacterized protein LOC110234508 [Exaiptasia diaphana]|uniref:AIG1-type G domain-containing protein n=1 Tax=Exaiptasia diaphana TaxID=2652724 RepID=A0A913WXA1_EXADI|nr:uncharacterized protein LOC110234508 [Exaiptasia diaphana]